MNLQKKNYDSALTSLDRDTASVLLMGDTASVYMMETQRLSIWWRRSVCLSDIDAASVYMMETQRLFIWWRRSVCLSDGDAASVYLMEFLQRLRGVCVSFSTLCWSGTPSSTCGFTSASHTSGSSMMSTFSRGGTAKTEKTWNDVIVQMDADVSVTVLRCHFPMKVRIWTKKFKGREGFAPTLWSISWLWRISKKDR